MSHHSRRATIAVIGVDGAGKTTQARRLTDWLRATGQPATYRMAAGGRRILGNAAQYLGRNDSVALLGPELALRTETLIRHVNLTLSQRAIVLVADRYNLCQFARTRMLDPDLEPWVRRTLARHPRPDLTIYLSIPPEVAATRIKRRGIDVEPVHGLVRLDAAYRSLPEADDFLYLDADRTPDAVSVDIRKLVRSALPELFVGKALLMHGPNRHIRRTGVPCIADRRRRRLPGRRTSSSTLQPCRVGVDHRFPADSRRHRVVHVGATTPTGQRHHPPTASETHVRSG
ncbi:MAG TPA: thymidylate kinase [Candidatus Stackebrandtia excrementipullorum]|nr:thymidylate kinase [Candidatus Stackebrandtia excrementipullorum]